jgi:hypothetical protein
MYDIGKAIVAFRSCAMVLLQQLAASGADECCIFHNSRDR